MATAPQPSKAAVLNSWKEIADYLGRGVRTVQRYEHDLKLPVRRPRGKSRSAVIALTSDLDEWLRNTPQPALAAPTAKAALPHMAGALHESVREMAQVRNLCHELRSANLEAVRTLCETIQQMQELLKFSSPARMDLPMCKKPDGMGNSVDVSLPRIKPN